MLKLVRIADIGGNQKEFTPRTHYGHIVSAETDQEALDKVRANLDPPEVNLLEQGCLLVVEMESDDVLIVELDR